MLVVGYVTCSQRRAQPRRHQGLRKRSDRCQTMRTGERRRLSDGMPPGSLCNRMVALSPSDAANQEMPISACAMQRPDVNVSVLRGDTAQRSTAPVSSRGCPAPVQRLSSAAQIGSRKRKKQIGPRHLTGLALRQISKHFHSVHPRAGQTWTRAPPAGRVAAAAV